LLLPRFLRDIRLQRFDVICAGLQIFIEDMLVPWVRNCIMKTGIRKVVCGGGVFMNVKANKLIMELPEVEYLGIMPSCGDESLSYGSAALAYRNIADQADLEPWNSIYFGHDVSDTEAECLLREKGIRYSRPADIELEIAKLVAAGYPVARCRGQMEFGARALGNRSILADPINPACVRVINQMVKKRDFWMPFAPMVLVERVHEYLVNPKNFPSPHMMLSFGTRETSSQFIAAVHSADLTARAQIIEEKHNPDMYHCLKHFEALTGRGIILNTSFNLHGYPIVHGPKEALHVFLESGLNHLALGNFLVTKASS
jgi:carbamoyltransferase